MIGHNSFDYALTPTNRVFMADVTKSGIYKWTTPPNWDNAQDPNWDTDTRNWEYGDYTITQTSKKQQHSDPLWYKYQDTVIATDKEGKQIHEIVGPTLTYDNDTMKFSQIDTDRNILANAMQAYLDDYDPSVSDNGGSGGGTTGSEDTDPNDCASENRNVNTDETCGDCVSGYSEDDDADCVADEEEEENGINWLMIIGVGAVAAFALLG